jgi:entry exclusion lipoprotein TrbK
MKTKTPVLITALVVTMVLTAACNDKSAIASPPCMEFSKTTDPKLRAELAKKCPRGGPVFRPSSGKTW